MTYYAVCDEWYNGLNILFLSINTKSPVIFIHYVVWFLSTNLGDGRENTSLIKKKISNDKLLEIFSSHIKSSKFPSNCLSWTNYLKFEYNITALHIDRNEIEIKSTFVIQLHFRLMFPFFHSALYIFFPLFFSFYFSYVTLSRKYFMLPCKQFFSPSLLPVMYHC